MVDSLLRPEIKLAETEEEKKTPPSNEPPITRGIIDGAITAGGVGLGAIAAIPAAIGNMKSKQVVFDAHK